MTTGSKSSTAFFQSILGHFPEYTTSYAHFIEGELSVPASRGYWEKDSLWCLWELRLCFSLSQSAISSLTSEAVTRSVNKIQRSKFEDLVGFIMWFINQTASHLVTRRALSLGPFSLHLQSQQHCISDHFSLITSLSLTSLFHFSCRYRADYFYLFLNIFFILKIIVDKAILLLRTLWLHWAHLDDPGYTLCLN